MDAAEFDRMSLSPFARRTPLFSATLLMADLIVYSLFVYGTLAVESVWLKLLLGFGAGTMISLAAIAGHDAGHQSFSGSKRVNRFFGTLAFLPALHPFALWEHHHNRVHHRFTAQLGVDNAFPPMTLEDYRSASKTKRAYYRFIRSLWGQPFFYLLDVWVPTMLVPFLQKEPRMTPRIWFDLVLMYVYFGTFLLTCTYVALSLAGDGNVIAALGNAFLYAFLVPFLIWNAFISFLSIVQHTGLDVRWTRPTGRPSDVEQSLAGTVHIVFPEFLDRLMHRIMQHQAHHLNVGIPLQNLVEAQRVVADANGGKLVHVWTPAYHLKLTRECQLYDPVRNRWCRFAEAEQLDAARELAA